MASPGVMLDGDAIAAPAPKSVAPAASTDRAVDRTDRLAGVRPFAAGDMLSAVVVMPMTLVAKGKGSLSVLGEYGCRILRP
jgi:hypothetical protein